MNNRYVLDKYSVPCVFRGKDSDGNIIYVIEASSKSKNEYYQSTKELVFGYNIEAIIEFDGKEEKKKVHILKCIANDKEHVENFELLVQSFVLNDSPGDDAKISSLFSIFLSMFSQEKNRSFTEIEGFFSELLFIYFMEKRGIQVFDKWQRKAKMKFDFYFGDNAVLDIKSTSKEQRVHHFLHEQLAVDLFDIVIVSFLTRLSDNGLNVLGLISKIRSELSIPLSAQKIIEQFVTNTKNKEDLENIRFDDVYMLDRMEFYKAVDIPKFNCKQPNGVSKTEYDSDLTNSKTIRINEIIDWMRKK